MRYGKKKAAVSSPAADRVRGDERDFRRAPEPSALRRGPLHRRAPSTADTTLGVGSSDATRRGVATVMRAGLTDTKTRRGQTQAGAGVCG